MGSGPSERESECDVEGAEGTRVDWILEVMLVVTAWRSSSDLRSQ